MKPSFVLEAEFGYTFEAGITPEGEVAEPGDISAFLDSVVDHLDKLDTQDVSLVLDAATAVFWVSILIPSQEEESIETVVGKGMGLLRTAFHACNANTQSWPTVKEAFKGVRVTPARVIAAEDPDGSKALTLA
jgi:hypothetical protein